MVSDTDEQGKEQLQTYIQNVGDHVSQVFQSVMNSVNEMIAFWNELSPSHYEDRPHLVSAMQGLAEVGEKLFPKADFQNEIALNMEETVKWSDQLEEARNVAFSIYSSWVADVLDEEGT